MANRILRRARRKEHKTMPWLQRLESAVVCIVSMGKAGPESRKLLVLHFSTGKKGVLLILLGKSRQMLGNIPKLSKWWKKQLEENLLIVVWRLQNESSGKLKKGGDSRQDLLASRALLGGSSKPRDKQVQSNAQGNMFMPLLLAALTPCERG